MTAIAHDAPTDRELVADSLAGDPEAFAAIVERYQSLVCSLTYSATGDVQTSEDLAQSTFLAAWRDLSRLQDPGRLKSWLCGIARHLAAGHLRRRRPAAPPDALDHVPSADSAPHDRATTREEQALVWRAVADLPGSLREPVVLYYRHDQSVRAVAELLDLSEDAVRQRLTRARAALRDSLSTLVETGLRSTRPTRAFTLSVLSALPLAAAAKASLVATAGNTARVVSVTSPGAWLAVIVPPALLGAIAGWRLHRDEGTPQGRRATRAFWRLTLVSVLCCTLLPLLLTFVLLTLFPQTYRDTILNIMKGWLGISYAAVAAGLLAWFVLRRGEPASPGPAPARSVKLPLAAFVSSAAILVLLYGFLDSARVTVISEPDMRALLTADPRPDELAVSQLTNGNRELVAGWPKQKRYSLTPLTPALQRLLDDAGLHPRIRLQGKDFEIFGAAGRLLPFLLIFILLASGTVLLGRALNARRNPA